MRLRIDHEITVRVIQGDSDLNKAVKEILSRIIKIEATMPTKAEFQAVAQEFRDAFLNISNDITRLTDQLSTGGLTDAEEQEVIAEFRQLATDAKAIADRTTEPTTPPIEPPVEG
jgi:hypothetical protein